MSRLIQFPRYVFELVMELVIPVFPVADLCRLRTVCKEWNEIITTRAFKENGQLRFNRSELLAICNIDCSAGFQAYDVEAQKWHSFDSSFLPDAGDDGFRVLDFAGGLACVLQTPDVGRLYPKRESPVSNPISKLKGSLPTFLPLSERDMGRALYVCNPLTKRWVQLPSPPTSYEDLNSYSYGDVIVRTWYCREMGHYKVFVVSGYIGVNQSLNQLVIKEFDSSSWEWVVHSQICDLFWWTKITGVGVLPCNNGTGASLFILLDNRKPHDRQVFALLFDEDKGASAFLKIGCRLPSNLLNPRMVCCEGSPRPLLVSAIRDGDGGTGITGIKIWELNNELTEWIYVSAMPSDLFTHFESLYGRRGAYPAIGPTPKTMVDVPHKHLIYVHEESEMSWTIAYDTLRRSWLWFSTKLPSNIRTTMLSKMNFFGRFSDCAFEPSLAKVVTIDG